ncbi:MAG: flagellar hook-length control protein FliK [Desulfosalsimonadaceae bacterium]
MMASSSAAMALAGTNPAAGPETGSTGDKAAKSLFAGKNGEKENFLKVLANAENSYQARALFQKKQGACSSDSTVREALDSLMAAIEEKGLFPGQIQSDQKLAALLGEMKEEAETDMNAAAMAALLELLAAGSAASAGEQAPDGGAAQPEKAGQSGEPAVQGDRIAALFAEPGRSPGAREQIGEQSRGQAGAHKAGENKQGFLQAEGGGALSADLQRLLENFKPGDGQTEGAHTTSQRFSQLARIFAQAAGSAPEGAFLQEGKTGGEGVEARLQRILQAGAAAGESFREADSAAVKSGMSAVRDFEAQIRELLGKTEADAKPGRGETAGPTSSSGADAAAFARANTGERGNAGQEESGEEQGLRQLLQQLAGREKTAGSGSGNGQKQDPAFADILGGKADSVDAEQLLRQAGAEKSDAKPGALKQNSRQTADILGQTQSGGQGGDKTQSTAASGAQQTGGSFDRALQGAENRIVSQVFVRLFSGVRQGSGNMNINMHPPELGTVKVRIHSESGHLQVSLHAQNHQVAGVLERHLPALQQSFAGQGIEVSDLQVSVDSGGEEGQTQFDEQAFSEAERGFANSGAAEEQEPEERQPAREPESSAGHSGLSLRV